MNNHFTIKDTDPRFQEVQALLQALLSETDRICRHLGLNYALFYDTLWGALCHRNFRSSSENAHVVLARSDYEILLEALREGRLNPRFELELPGGAEGSIRSYARLCCKKTHVQRVPDLPLNSEYFPVSLCLLPLDSTAETALKQGRRLRRIRAWTEAMRLKGPHLDSITEASGRGDGSIELQQVYAENVAEAAVSPFEVWLKSLLPKSWAIKRREQLMRGHSTDNEDKCAIYMPMAGLIAVTYVQRQLIFPVASIPLGKKAYSCPSKAHEVLTQLYGNYRCDYELEGKTLTYAAFEFDTNYWADVIYADDPAAVV